MKTNGPLFNRDFGGFDRPRAIYSGMPEGLSSLGEYLVVYDDFIGKAFNATDTWNVIKDTSATVALDDDTVGGAVLISSNATTDDDGGSIQYSKYPFLVKAGLPLWFEARVKVSSAADCDMFIGLAETFATDPEAVVAEGCARVGFELVDGSAVLKTVIDNDTASTKTALSVSMGNASYRRLGFRVEGGSIRFYVDRALVSTQSIPAAIAAIKMGPAFFGLSGSDSGTHTRSCEYILAVSKKEF